MAKSPEEYAHLEWLGYVQPIGLVVSVPAMLEAQCYINNNVIGEHKRFLDCLPRDAKDEIVPEITDFAEFAHKSLEWEEDDLKEIPQKVVLPDELSSLEVLLPQYHETLRPTHAVPVFRPKEDEIPWQMLIQNLPTGTEFDEPSEADSSRHWHASPQLKFERLLRETQVPIGLLCNGRQLRLVYAPRGESSGHATFNVAEMVQVAGRPMFAAFHMLLSADRMFTLGDNQRLPAILENSRKYQNTVSTQLAEQVLAALYELMRGFQAANDVRKGELLRKVLANDPNHVYSGLLTVLMRLVFVLYAEDRDLMSSDPVYSNNYSVTGLFERLREDQGRFPDTMDQRFGAWSQLLTLYRLVYEGGQHSAFKLPARKGYLFDPDRYPFLEGRSEEMGDGETAPVPRISDGVVFRVLQDLLILNGERLSYRALDVEQIGSVYETMMGFDLETAQGKSIAIKPVKSHGAPATINLEGLLETQGKDRAKWIKEFTDQKIGREALKELKAADSIDGLLEALDKKIHKAVTPRVVSKGAIVLQPSDERRRSGSHYTPRSLTEPIVRTTLEPILKQLVDPEAELPTVWKPTTADKKRYTPGEIAERIRLSEIRVKHAEIAREKGSPHPSQILDLKVCDPAMGSGAFLVETCRQLGDELVAAWNAHECVPTDDIPADEDEILYARRLIAQRCLYGVDKNDMAVDLAKLSLWLVTLARDHAFTFLDHSLRHGDSLVGLTREQIIGFHWDRKKFKTLLNEPIQKRLDRATEARAKILNAREDVPYRDQEQRLAVADEALDLIRSLGDACVSCFFAESKKKAREEEADRVYGLASSYLESHSQQQVDHASRQSLAQAAARLAHGEHPVPAFHWEIEFPEVFSRENGGFDAFVGNPPFLGGSKISTAFGSANLAWLLEAHLESHGNGDLVAHFLRRAFDLCRKQGVFGLITTNTISQGDTRTTGLRWIRCNGGSIYYARRSVKWPGDAAVTVSVVHVIKSSNIEVCYLDHRRVPSITAYLFHSGGDENPKSLKSSTGRSYSGSKVTGKGFVLSRHEAEIRFAESSENKSIVLPYLDGEELNSDPSDAKDRFVICFAEMTFEEASKWPSLVEHLESTVKIQRSKNKRAAVRDRWWLFEHYREGLYEQIGERKSVLVNSQVSKHLIFSFVSANQVFSHALNVYPNEDYGSFAILQSRVHEVWARFFASSLEDRLRYTPSDCFETFPFVHDKPALDALGEEYFASRIKLGKTQDCGLTSTYNRFHSPDERDEGIFELRRLHGLMDGAVLRAYGWDDLAESAKCEFLLDYEEDEDDEPGGKKSNKKKPWRYRWPDDFRDEVLARLLELNEQRHKEELLAGETAEAKAKSVGSKSRRRKSSNDQEPSLF